MRLINRAGLAVLMVVTSVSASTTATERATGIASDDGEVWVTAQNASEIKILLGMGGIETIALRAGSAPHTINFSPDGSYAYVSNLNGDLSIIRADDRQIVATLHLAPVFTHDTKASPDGSVLLSANPMTRLLTKIAADEQAETWVPVGALDLGAATGRGPVCVAFRSDGERAYASLGGAGGIAIVDVPTMALIGMLPTAGQVTCGLVNSKDGRTIFVVSEGGTGHFYRLNTDTDTLTEETGYGSIGLGLHGFLVNANEKRAYIAARATDEIKVLDLNGTDVSTISVDSRFGLSDEPHNLARKGSTVYVALRFAGQVARIRTQTGQVDYIDVAPPATTSYGVHGIAVRP